ncbi:MAG: hypothetical protein ACI8QD_002024 [Cyclobacteriaceae bacterium]|jgi:hypothetical protein
MGDQFERFIKDNREDAEKQAQLDADKRWASISHKISASQRKPRQLHLVWKVAASLLLISTLVLLTDRMVNRQEVSSINTVTEEFAAAEKYYSELIEDKRVQLVAYQEEGLTVDFQQDIRRLDIMYKELQKTYQTASNDPKVIYALINNLQLRIDILNQQLGILERLQQQENGNYETI